MKYSTKDVGVGRHVEPENRAARLHVDAASIEGHIAAPEVALQGHSS